MCSAPKQGQAVPAGVDLEKETVITGRVVDDAGQTVGGAFVRLLDSSDEFTAEVVASATGDFRFFAAPGTWRVRALSKVGNGDVVVAPPAPASTRLTSRSLSRLKPVPAASEQFRTRERGPARLAQTSRTRLTAVVLFFEFMLVAAAAVITWFALYALYRLISDES